MRFLETALVSATLPVSRQGEQVQRSRWEGGRFHVARTWTWPLLKQLLRGRLRLAEPLFDIAGLPMAYGVFALLLALCVPVAGIRIYAIASLLVVAAHVLAAAASRAGCSEDAGAAGYVADLHLVEASSSSRGSAWIEGEGSMDSHQPGLQL